MLIKNYGLFWRREWIVWGAGSNAGHLKGVPAKQKTAHPVDFRDQQGVYVLYDDNFQIVYVGQAGAQENQRLLKRLGQHRSDQLADRWTKLSWFGVRKVNQNGSLAVEAQAAHTPMNDVLDHIEAVLIAAAEPRHNRQGGRFGDGVKQFLQHRDHEALGPDQPTMIRALYDDKFANKNKKK
jgi:hypothetical protein